MEITIKELLKLSISVKMLHTDIYCGHPFPEINLSKHVSEYKFNKKEAILIHLGFAFRMQNGKMLELFYDLNNNITVRQQKINTGPMILGLVYYFKQDYIDKYDNKILKTINLDNQTSRIIETNDESKFIETGAFEIVEKSKVLSISSLMKTHNDTLHFDGSRFTSLKEYKQFRKDEILEQQMFDDADREVESWDEDFPGWSGDR